MCAHHILPVPLNRMFKHLRIDIERSFQLTPNEMKSAIRTCQMCNKLRRCDFDSESRYFRCPHRGFLDQLADTECYQ